MIYLVVEDLIQLHKEALDAHGGEDGLDVNGHQQLTYIIDSQYPIFGKDQYPGVFLKAANIFYLINKDHPFVDGNKRTALLATLVLLGKNGFKFVADPDSAERFTEEIASVDPHMDEFDKDEYIEYIANWLQSNTKRIQEANVIVKGKLKKFQIPPW